MKGLMGFFRSQTISRMLTFDTEDVDEHYWSGAFFGRCDQKKVCFYKWPQMDFVKKAIIYHEFMFE